MNAEAFLAYIVVIDNVSYQEAIKTRGAELRYLPDLNPIESVSGQALRRSQLSGPIAVVSSGTAVVAALEIGKCRRIDFRNVVIVLQLLAKHYLSTSPFGYEAIELAKTPPWLGYCVEILPPEIRHCILASYDGNGLRNFRGDQSNTLWRRAAADSRPGGRARIARASYRRYDDAQRVPRLSDF